MAHRKYMNSHEIRPAHQLVEPLKPLTRLQNRDRLIRITAKYIIDTHPGIGSWDELTKALDVPGTEVSHLPHEGQIKKNGIGRTRRAVFRRSKNDFEQNQTEGEEDRILTRNAFYLIRVGLAIMAEADTKFPTSAVDNKKSLVTLLRQAHLSGRLYHILERFSDRQNKAIFQQSFDEFYAKFNLPCRNRGDYTKPSERVLTSLQRLRRVLLLPTRDYKLLGVAQPLQIPGLNSFINVLQRRNRYGTCQVTPEFRTTMALALRLAFSDENPLEPGVLSRELNDIYPLRPYYLRISSAKFNTLPK